MSGAVDYRVEEGVAILSIANPPVNALSHAVRAGLLDGLTRAEDDPEIRAIVLRAEGRTFPAGADITEFGAPAKPPGLGEVCTRIEACPKLVVVALFGTVLGGGFELALAAHYRIAARDTRLGFPEVGLGLVPGAGGTQRVPRIAGAAAALDLMISGRPVRADRAVDLGLVDGLVDDNPSGAAFAYARELSARDVTPRRTGARRDGMQDAAAYVAAIRTRRAQLAGSPQLAPLQIIDCVEAALLLPFETGLEYERAAFEDLLESDQSAALRHAFFAERRAAKIPDLAGAHARPVDHVGVVGGGLMGTGIALACLDAGLAVTLIERDDEALENGVWRIIETYDRQIEKGRLSEQASDDRVARLRGTTDYRELGEADLVIEAATEDLSVKREVFRALDATLKAGAVLATNTSYLDINMLAGLTSRPSDVIGLHFFSPAQVMRLVEVVIGEATSRHVTATGFALAKRLGKVAVRAGMSDGFIGNRILTAYRQAADFMLEDGAGVAEIDAAMRAYGFAMGPYQAADLAGLDIAWDRRKRQADTRDPALRYVAIADRLCEAGRFGQKSGRGYYLYPRGTRKAHPDPDVTALVEAERARKGIVPRAIPAGEIQRRCLAAMVNEGARVVAEGVALRPSDVDMVMIHGFGFPRWHGGPMKAADLAGLLHIRQDLERFAAEDPEFWAPAPLFDELIKNGQTFDALNADPA